MKKTIFYGLFIVILLLTTLYVVVSNKLSTSGVELDDIQDKLTQYRKQNLVLHEQVLEQSSLYHVASIAASMGFVREKSHLYIPAPLPLAKK